MLHCRQSSKNATMEDKQRGDCKRESVLRLHSNVEEIQKNNI